MAVLQSEVRITGHDAGVAAMFEKISNRIDQMAKTAKVSKPFSSLVDGLSKAEAQMKALDRVNSTKAIVEVARQRAAATKAALDQSRQLVAATEAPTKAMQRDLAAREAAHAKVLAMYRREMTAAMEAKRVAQEQGLSLRDREGQQAALRRTIESTTQAMERQVAVERKATLQAAAMERAAHQRREFIERRGIGHVVTQAAGNFLAAHSIVQGVEHATVEGANLAHVQNQARAAGIPALEVQGMTDQALDLSRHYKNVSQESLIELAKEVRSAVVHPDEVPAIMPTMAAAKSVLDGADRSGEASGNLGSLVKGAEAIGAAQNPERLARLIDSYVKAIQVMGKTITPEQIYEFDKYSKTAGARMSDRFLMTTGLSLSQELGGSTAANDIFQAQKAITGGFQNKHIPLGMMADVGLIDKDDIVYAKGSGEAKGLKRGAHVKGDNLAASDLDLWVYREYLPRLEAKGMKSVDEQLNFTQRAFTGAAADVISKMITQRESFAAHAERYGEASGIKGADQMQTDPLVAWSGFTTQLSNLAANLAEPAVKAAGPALDSIAAGLGNLSASVAQFNKDHPTFAPVAETAGAAGAVTAAGYAAWRATQGTARLFGRMIGLGGGEAAAAGEAAGIAGAAGGEAGAVAGTVGAAGAALPLLAGLGLAGGGIYLLSHMGGEQTGSGRYQPPTKRKTDGPGHVAYDRGGAPIWVADPMPPTDNVAPPAVVSLPPAPTLAPPLDIRPPAQREGMAAAAPPPVAPPPGAPQTVDVTGKVQADVTSHVETAFTNRIEITGLPVGISATPVFQSQATRVSTGPSMPNAGAAPHVSRRDE